MSSLQVAFAEALVSVSKNGDVIRRCLSDIVEEVQACGGPLFPKGLGAALYKTDGGKWDQWVAYRGCDPEPLENILKTRETDLVRCAASNPTVRSEWLEGCMRRGRDYASAVILGLPEDKVLGVYHGSGVDVSVPAFERVVAVAFKYGPEHLANLRGKKVVENLEIFVYNVLGVAEANIESLRWYSRVVRRDLWRGRRYMSVNNVESWVALVRNLPAGERRRVIKNLLPGGVVDRLRAMRFDGDDICDGLKERELLRAGTWHSASWRNITRRKLTKRAVRKILKADRYPRGFLGMLQLYDITAEGLHRHGDLKNRLECGDWLEGGSIGGLALQDALVPYLLDHIESVPEVYKHYDYSAFWRSLHRSRSSWREKAAQRCGSLLQYADPAHVDEAMFVAAGSGEWRRSWLELCYTPRGRQAAPWAILYIGESSLTQFPKWELAARQAVLEHVQMRTGDTVATWETTRALLANWHLGAEKLVTAVQKLGNTA